MRYIADLHVHSKYSRATAKNLDLEHLYIYAQLKGITVVAAGDYTHPAWFAEISEKLIPAEEGFFRLADNIAAACDRQVPTACRGDVRFVLATEISNIYKKEGQTRKNHNLIFMPGLEQAARFNARLNAIGNIKADGRPILGLDARDLLEIALDISEAAFLIPAHIWTPWFSVFGSKSGFDSLRDCFADLTPHIFALETGLSSDPAMNWRISDIDGLTLVSSSDAHSPAKLGREACLFDTELCYEKMRQAIKTGDPRHYLGTFEFYPQEGKYHYDGHRRCGIRRHPAETIKAGGNCPVCNKPLTLGVLYRVEQLADRPPGGKPAQHHPYYSIIPLEEMLSEIIGVGPKTKKVAAAYTDLLEKLGSEFEILYTTPEEDIHKKGIPLLDIAVNRMRRGRIRVEPGYDGEYGRIRVFEDGEMDGLRGQQTLFPPVDRTVDRTVDRPGVSDSAEPARDETPPIASGLFDPGSLSTAPETADTGVVTSADILAGLNPLQRRAVFYGSGPLMIVAGPGSGKTRTITCRMARLIKDDQADSRSLVAITFTNRAAREMKERLSAMLPSETCLPPVTTFHSLCLGLLHELGRKPTLIMDETDQSRLIGVILRTSKDPDDAPAARPARFLNLIARAKQRLLAPEDDLGSITDIPAEQLSHVYRAYQEALKRNNACDYEDLIVGVVRHLSTDKTFRDKLQKQYRYVFIDEYQDVNYCQYRLVQLLTPPDGNICVIGDPDQAIYGFRGSDAAFFTDFDRDFPGVEKIFLDKNYRSTDTILTAAYDVIRKQGDDDQRVRVCSGLTGAPLITVARLASDKAEAVYTGKTIEALVGGLGFHSVDFGTAGYEKTGEAISFDDIAVLFRTRKQADLFTTIFDSAGIPFQVVSRENLFDCPGISELLSWLRLCEGCGSFIDFERVAAAADPPVRPQALRSLDVWSQKHNLSPENMLLSLVRFPVDGIGPAVQRVLAALAETVQDARADMEWMRVAEKTGYLLDIRPELRTLIGSEPRRQEALDLVLATADKAGDETARFFETVALASDADTFIPKADRVRMMTLHASKGLEFSVVFVIGCEDGLIPLRRPGDDQIDPDEERRLFYVAMTRARSRLFFTWAEKRRLYGKTQTRIISPYVEEIEERLKETAAPERRRKPGQGAVQLELF